MRIAVGQLWQETNTFNRNPTTLADFENWGVAEGDAVLERYGETGEIGGFLAGCRQWGPQTEFVGLARFACWPWGSVDRETWKHIRGRFIERLEAAGPVDAVFLALHGAMAADGEDDLTGALLQLVRERVGPDVPIVGTLDLHANITPRMIDTADLLVGYHACPHLDGVQTGERAAAGLKRIIDCGGTGRRTVTRWRKLPMITAAESHNTFTGPPAFLYRRLEQLEREENVLSAGLYMAMPWLDCARLGWTVTLTTLGEKKGTGSVVPEGRSAEQDPSTVPVPFFSPSDGAWQTVVDELAADCWNLRQTMEDVIRYPPAEVVERALRHGGYPVVIGDGADATNSGSPGDQTHLLREFLKQPSVPHGALTFLVDPEATAAAWTAGVGAVFDMSVGGSFAPEYCDPVPFRGTVERLLDVEFVLDGHGGNRLPIRMGRGAVVRSGDVTVLLTEKNGPGSTPRLYETAGLDPRTFGIVVAKSPAGFRADYEPFAAGILLADCPGCASPNWKRMHFHRADRPLWPLDPLDQPDEAWCSDL